jgi:hypothetical protein
MRGRDGDETDAGVGASGKPSEDPPLTVRSGNSVNRSTRRWINGVWHSG